nr:hypothetical protein [Tanacetum cinerariifolium]
CNLLSNGISLLQQGKLSSLTVGTSSGSGNSSLAVRMPCAFYSQQSSPKLDAPSAIKEDAFNYLAVLDYWKSCVSSELGHWPFESNSPPEAYNLSLLSPDPFSEETTDSNSESASSKSVTESSLNSATKDVHAIKYKMSKAKARCMTYFRSLKSHLQVLSKEDFKGTSIEYGFKWAFMSLFD